METGAQREPGDIRWMRILLNIWPLPRGKGILLKLFRSRLQNRDFLIEIEPGVLIPGELDDWMVLWFFTEGYKKNPSLLLSRSLIRPGDTVLDVGANIGLWVIGAARLAGAEGEVHAFEPVHQNFARLTRNMALNGLRRVICQQMAVSDQCGRAVFYAPTNHNSGLGSLVPRETATRSVEIESTTLDGYCEKYAIARVDFLKVDVEGAELLVFRGAERLLASPEAPVIMFETDETLTSRFSSSSVILKTFLHQYGYDFFHYDGKRLQRTAVNESHDVQVDLFALKPFHFERHSVLRTLMS